MGKTRKAKRASKPCKPKAVPVPIIEPDPVPEWEQEPEPEPEPIRVAVPPPAPQAAPAGFPCPACGCCHFHVISTRWSGGVKIVRRRECRYCGRRMTTFERPG